ncbi:maleylpyruvate isomerase family mycothiol-dependent enzyme [Nonomuraea sp. bgisy101]|uniref:maleylpyruvate isomerase family mycothiol-dependent enzyme n=1 Tax=Nonomuraea sp. bgisy101 TaxID=3413784 RepID=UPI003D704F3D
MVRDWTHEDHTEAAVTQIERMADTVREADFGAPVPTCPGWNLEQLVRHTGSVHRWAARMVRELAPKRLDRTAIEAEAAGRPAGELPGWLHDGARALGEALTLQKPGEPVWAWGGDRHVRFWSRRQLHETAVHHADAALALGRPLAIDENVAADGVEEFLDVLPYARWRPQVAELAGEGETIAWRTGTGAAWLITLHPSGFTYERAAERATADVTATLHADTAADLLLLAWGRRSVEQHRVEGETTLLSWWADRSMI